MKKSLKIIGLFYLLIVLCSWTNLYLGLFPKEIFGNVCSVVFLGGTLVYIIVKNRIRLLKFIKKCIACFLQFIKSLIKANSRNDKLEETSNKSTGLSSYKKKSLLSIGLWILGIFMIYLIMLVAVFAKVFSDNDASHNINNFWGSLLNTSGMILIFILTCMYWLPSLFACNNIDLRRKEKLSPNTFGNLLQTKREKYMVFIVGGIIGLSLFLQGIFHSYALYQTFDMKGIPDLIFRCIYLFGYAFVSSVLIVLIYNKIEAELIKQIMKISAIMYLMMLPAVYFIPLMINEAKGLNGLMYVFGGIAMAPLLVFLNGITFFIVILIWYFIMKRIIQKTV